MYLWERSEIESDFIQEKNQCKIKIGISDNITAYNSLEIIIVNSIFGLIY